MNDERLLSELSAWLQEEKVPLPDAEAAGHQIAALLPHVQQRRRHRWWPAAHTHHHTTTTTTDIRRTRTMLTPSTAITAGALALALGGVLLVMQPFAQQDGTVPPGAIESAPVPPAEFSGTIPAQTGRCVAGSTGVSGVVETLRGYGCEVAIEDSTDPRFSGTWSFALSEDGYYGDGIRTLWTTVYRVENDEGAWVSAPVSGIEFDDRETTVTAVFAGEGAYDGLTAVVELARGDLDSTGSSETGLRGAIVSGPLPPPSDIER